MATKSEIKYFSALRQKKYRKFERKFLAEGKRLVEEGLNSNFECIRIFVTNNFNSQEFNFIKKLESKKIKVDIVTVYEFSKFAGTQNPQGIVAVFKIPERKISKLKSKIIVCLDNISDPGNLGTILRSCSWFGIKTVLLSKGSADLYNPKVVRASMGAVFNLNILEDIEIISILKDLKEENYLLYYADMEGEDYRKIDYKKPTALIFSNEAFGPSEDVKNVCDAPLTIPAHGKIDSLNVAAAAAVILSRTVG